MVWLLVPAGRIINKNDDHQAFSHETASTQKVAVLWKEACC